MYPLAAKFVRFGTLLCAWLSGTLFAEAVRIYRDSVIPAAKKQHGFKGALLLTDSITGKGYSITEWETEADMKAGETSGYYEEQIAKFGQLLTSKPIREGFQVSLQV